MTLTLCDATFCRSIVGSIGLSLILYPTLGGGRCDRFLQLIVPGSLQKCGLGAVRYDLHTDRRYTLYIRVLVNKVQFTC